VAGVLQQVAGAGRRVGDDLARDPLGLGPATGPVELERPLDLRPAPVEVADPGALTGPAALGGDLEAGGQVAGPASTTPRWVSENQW
jgi:hypothetical protein